MAFSGRLRVRGRTVALAPGRYRLNVAAVDPANNRTARTSRVAFRVVR